MHKALVKITATLFFCFGLLLFFMLCPSVAYSHSFQYKNITVHYSGELRSDLTDIIDQSLATIEKAALYNADFKTDLCLNEGVYPRFIKTLLGDDVFTAFDDKVVVLGKDIAKPNRFLKWSRELDYSQFLSHAILHNLQFLHHGLFSSNPLGRHPQWKWEGYVEYEVLGQVLDLAHLLSIVTDQNTSDYEWIEMDSSRGTIKQHVKYLTLVKYCFETKGWNYDQLMQSTMSEETVFEELLQFQNRIPH